MHLSCYALSDAARCAAGCTPPTHCPVTGHPSSAADSVTMSAAVTGNIDWSAAPIASGLWLARCSSSVVSVGPNAVTNHLEGSKEALRSSVAVGRVGVGGERSYDIENVAGIADVADTAVGIGMARLRASCFSSCKGHFRHGQRRRVVSSYLGVIVKSSRLLSALLSPIDARDEVLIVVETGTLYILHTDQTGSWVRVICMVQR